MNFPTFEGYNCPSCSCLWVPMEIMNARKGKSDHYYKGINKMLSYRRDRAAGCVIVFAKSRRLELIDNILRTL